MGDLSLQEETPYMLVVYAPVLKLWNTNTTMIKYIMGTHISKLSET